MSTLDQIKENLLNRINKQKLPPFLRGSFLLIITIFIISSCISDEEYSNSPFDRLSASNDTINFDTIFSGQPTITKTIELYNKTNKNIRIKNIYLEKSNASIFHINVDGVYITKGQIENANIEVASKDSIRVFAMANIFENKNNAIQKWEDILVLETEGGAQNNIIIQAHSQNAKRLSYCQIDKDTTLTNEIPYIVKDSIVVKQNATLTLSPGCKFYFCSGAKLIVHGTLIAEGSIDNKIIMRGERNDNMFPNQPYDRVPGQWGGIEFTTESKANHLNFCDIHSCENGIVCDSSYNTTEEKIRIENTILHNMSGYGLYAKASKIFVGNSQITNCGKNCITLLGGNNTFIHCTIGRFYVFAGGEGCALYYTNYLGKEKIPLEAANFYNCIITGYSDDEILGNPSTENRDIPFNYYFHRCLLNTPQIEADEISECLWDNSKDDHKVWREDNFSPKFDLSKILFKFTLNEDSQATNNADPTIAQEYYQYDLNGHSRLIDNGPDIGCYEFQEEKD